jgi:hypothetical protein
MHLQHLVVSSLGASRSAGDSIERAKGRLAELESLLTEKGSATISKP